MPKLHCINLTKEREGVEFAYPHQEGITVRLARLNNPAMIEWQNGVDGRERLRELMLKHPPEEARLRFFREAIGRYVVRGWSGIDRDDGPGLLDYSEEASVAFMLDPRRHQWQAWVVWQSEQMAAYLEDQAASAAGNSVPA